MLFISFSLDVIQQRVDHLHDGEQVILIENAAGEAVAYAGGGRPSEHIGHEHPSMPIEGSDWSLHYMAEEGGTNVIFVYTLGAAALILMVSGTVMLMLSLRLVTLFKRDLATLKGQLDTIHSDDSKGAGERDAVLTETTAIMNEVWSLMGAIQQNKLKLQELSVKDELSGLYNRRGFMDSLEKSLELSDRGVGSLLLLLDLDHFKSVNDSHGHAAGDEVIKALAQAIRERCRGSDVPARLGGDEFAVILNATRDAQAVEQWYSDLAARFAQLQAEQLPSLPAEAYCTISAGWAVIDKHQYANIDQQLEAADQALYRAKSQGRGRIIA